MPYNEQIADRVRRAVSTRTKITEKRMFGGLVFLLDGKMFCGIAKDELMVRVGPERDEASLAEKHVRPMDFTGRPMKGYIFVEPAGCRTDQSVKKWVDIAATFVTTLRNSPKPKQKKSR
jgi:TfoX/Sxy family transcriptional regulator of competence genes